MYIYQPDRILLKKQITKFAHFISGDVLDVGGGDLNRYQKLFSYKSYTKLDITEGEEVDIVASADNIPRPDASFDSIVCMQVMEHVQFPEKVVQEMSRVIKPGGYALITLPQNSELHEEPHDYWRYTNHGFRALFQRNGFDTVEIEARGGYYTTCENMRIRYLMDKYQPYRRPILGRLMSRIFRIRISYALWRDSLDKSDANRKQTIGWCGVFRKRMD